MCGIGGAVLREGASFDIAAWALRMDHRGPDDHGWAVFAADGTTTVDGPAGPVRGQVMIGQGRLTIIDLTERGHQPFFTPDGRYCLSYNGEIYNYVELRRSLEAEGTVFRSDSDTEVLLHGLIRHGAPFLDRLIGMYGFALFDKAEKSLMLGRDPFGMKPLYLAEYRDGLAFASEINGFYGLPGIDLETPAQAVFNYLRHGATDNGRGTLTAGIRNVLPGSVVTIDTARAQVTDETMFWTPGARPELDIGFAEAVERLRELFLHSVAIHMRSDVPIAVAASGGLDSSWVLAAVRHAQPNGEVRAFSFTAPGEAVDESRWATMIAGATKAEHHKFVIDPAEMIASIPNMVVRQGEPVGGLSVFAQHMLYRHVNEAGLKVILEGQGADELFGGYVAYAGPRVGAALRRGKLGEALASARAAPAATQTSALTIAQFVAQDILPSSMARWARSLAGRSQTPAWLRRDWLREHGVRLNDHQEVRSGAASLRDVLAHDTTHNLTTLLRYGDRNAMAASVESRLPFLTPQIADFALALPDDYLFGRDGRSKRVVREAMRGLVPDAIVDRRDKIGFAPPHGRWLRDLASWVEPLLGDAPAHPAIDVHALRGAWRRFMDGGAVTAASLWRPINFLAWHAGRSAW